MHRIIKCHAFFLVNMVQKYFFLQMSKWMKHRFIYSLSLNKKTEFLSMSIPLCGICGIDNNVLDGWECGTVFSLKIWQEQNISRCFIKAFEMSRRQISFLKNEDGFIFLQNSTNRSTKLSLV